MARICLINPRFPVSFWGLNHGLPLLGKRANMPVLALPVLAGLTPPEHEVVLIDENIQEIDFDALESFDIVGLTGMTVQRDRMREILVELRRPGNLRRRGRPLDQRRGELVRRPGRRDLRRRGGGDLAEVPRGLAAGRARRTVRAGREDRHDQGPAAAVRPRPVPRIRDGLRPDLARLPVPVRVLRHHRDLRPAAPDQEARAGRRRDRRRSTGWGPASIFLVDDNFIGNKKAAKGILRAIIAWQQENGYPLTFFTEASLDLAEDEELMRLMTEAGLVAVFIGIESPDEEALRETKKYQNVRGSLVERVHRVQAHGLEVYAGMIVGFDSDDETVFDRQVEFLHQARIVGAMAGMLSAIPKTPLYDRLEAEGRLDNAAADDPDIATNIIPLLMTRETLRDGWLDLMDRLYHPEATSSGSTPCSSEGRIPLATARMNWLRRHRPLSYLKIQALTILAALVMLTRIWLDPRTRPYRRIYARSLRKLLLAAPPSSLPVPVRLEMRHAHPLRHHDAADGPRRVPACEHMSDLESCQGITSRVTGAASESPSHWGTSKCRICCPGERDKPRS